MNGLIRFSWSKIRQILWRLAGPYSIIKWVDPLNLFSLNSKPRRLLGRFQRGIVLSQLAPFVGFFWIKTGFSRLRDSITEAILVRVVDREAAEDIGGRLHESNRVTNTAEVRRLAKRWALALRKRLDEFGGSAN